MVSKFVQKWHFQNTISDEFEIKKNIREKKTILNKNLKEDQNSFVLLKEFFF